MALSETAEEKLHRIAEDVSYIKSKIETIPDHEARIRSLERWKWGGGAVTALLAGLLGLGNTLNH